ncbi:hypothetical protein JZ751_022943 [Albula glossodonta]|uniref:DH domain-containing protein n=1 Tax=Albula glossodonta TaxID=121402 RepID=A0A8T2PMI8_9TELE|nr:hypothetical protein JZ751_022943 [Albula glossodonta]
MTSSQDSAPQHPISPKPPIPRKPLRLKDSHFPLLTNRHGVTNTLDGKVKQIVDHFKLHENTVAGQNSEEGVQSCKETKTDPSVKPKPSAQCDPLLIQKTAQSQKRESQRHKQKAGSNTIPITSQRGRSAPDGMEVEINNLHKNKMGKGSAAPPSLSCKKGCTCICHLKQPNMRLMWVPMDKEKTEEGKEKEEGQRESEGKEQNKVTCRPLLKENKVKSVPCMTTVEVSPCTLQSNTCLHRSVGNEKEEAIGRVETRKESGGKAAPTVNMPKFQHRSHWYSPISSQASCIQQGPKVIEEAPPPIPPRSSRLTVKSANLHNSSTPPNNQICPPTEYGQLPNALMLHRLPPLLPLKPSQPKPERKALSCQFIPLSKDEEKDDYSEWGKVDMIEEKEATVISKVIQHHAVCCKINSTAVEVGALGNYVRPKKSTTQNSLWQELPSVRNSGVLQHLSPAERKRQESMFEVVTSEASYLRSLLVLTDHFLDSRDLNDTLIIHDKRTLFSNILRVREVSERFLRDLEQRVDEGPVISDVCDIIDYHAQHGFSAYIKYIRNQNILKRTQEGTKEEQTASKALASVSQIIQDSNSQVGKMRQMEELIQIAQMLEFHKLKASSAFLCQCK